MPELDSVVALAAVDLGLPAFEVVWAPPAKVNVEVQEELTEAFEVWDAVLGTVNEADWVADPPCPADIDVKLEPPSELVALAKRPAYDTFQADTEARTLDGIGAIVTWTLAHPEVSMSATDEYSWGSLVELIPNWHQ